MTLPATGMRHREPVHLGKAIEEEVGSLFQNTPEPLRSHCRFEFIDGKIQLREKLGRAVPDSLKRLRVELKEASRQAYKQEKQTA